LTTSNRSAAISLRSAPPSSPSRVCAYSKKSRQKYFCRFFSNQQQMEV
jgi:hypothetical protein